MQSSDKQVEEKPNASLKGQNRSDAQKLLIKKQIKNIVEPNYVNTENVFYKQKSFPHKIKQLRHSTLKYLSDG